MRLPLCRCSLMSFAGIFSWMPAGLPEGVFPPVLRSIAETRCAVLSLTRPNHPSVPPQRRPLSENAQRLSLNRRHFLNEFVKTGVVRTATLTCLTKTAPPRSQLARRARTRPKKAAPIAAKSLALALPAFASSARRIARRLARRLARQRQRRGGCRDGDRKSVV